MSGKTKLFIEAGSISEERFSGIGNTTINIVRTLSQDSDFTNTFSIYLLVPFNKVHNLSRWDIDKKVSIKRIFIPGRVMNLLSRLGVVPHMDVFLGKGVYLFPNFKNWPLLYSRSITYIHDIAYKRHPEYIQPQNLRLLEKNMDRWLKRTDTVVCVSHFTKSEIDYFYPNYESKTKVVHNGIDIKEFFPRSLEEQKVVAEKYGLSPKEYFMYLSNLEPRKNVEGLLNAYSVFCQKYPDLQLPLLMVGGMGWNNEAVLQKIHNMKQMGRRIIIPEHFVEDDDIPVLLSGAIAMTHLTHYEGFGLAQLQAIACGTALITTGNTSIPEVVGSEATYVDSNDVSSVVDAMYEAYKDRDTIHVSGVKYANKFTWEESLLPLKQIIKSNT
jgi:glycosyltransferase involved in cell wall biosynthesis